MAASPLFLSPPSTARRTPQRVRNVWFPVLCSLIFIAFTSTTLMSGYHTQFVVNDVWRAVFGNWHLHDWTGTLNGEGRKVGHFFGYGAIGLLFRNAWHTTLRDRAISVGASIVHARLLAGSMALSVLSIFLIASIDEFHQHFLPQRVGSFGDVLRDTGGTIFLNLVWLGFRVYRRREALAPASTFA